MSELYNEKNKAKQKLDDEKLGNISGGLNFDRTYEEKSSYTLDMRRCDICGKLGVACTIYDSEKEGPLITEHNRSDYPRILSFDDGRDLCMDCFRENCRKT